MTGEPRARGWRRPVDFFPNVITCISAVLIGTAGRSDPRYFLLSAGLVSLVVLPRVLRRRRERKVLLSGDVARVLEMWKPWLDRLRFAEGYVELMEATAYAAFGWVDAARDALARIPEGKLREAALEERLTIEALLDAFEGDRAKALAGALEVERMPLEAAGLFARRRLLARRSGLSALARAFSHQSEGRDERKLLRAGKLTPLFHWAMRYGAAVVAIDRGRMLEARELLVGAPAWPNESAFRVFDAELRALLPS